MGLKFCPHCSNYMNMFIDTSSDIKYKCRACGFEQSATTAESAAAASDAALSKATKSAAAAVSDECEACILDLTVREKGTGGKVIMQIDKYTLNDPTLPHETSGAIKCPNDKCSSNKGETTPDVIYIKYDSVNLQYIYVCTRCDFKWKSSE